MGKIPKNIFVYWHEEKMPYIIYKMYKNLKHKHKDFKIYKFNDRILKEKIKNIPDGVLINFDNKTIVSDWLRLHLLYKYGGIWADISNIFLKSINEIVDFNADKLQAYKLFSNKNGIENWFIASPPKTNLVKLWLKECIIAFKDKKKYQELNGRYDTNNELNLPHLAQHLAFIKVIYENDLTNDYKLLGDLYLEKFNYLPFHYHFKFKWNSYKLAEFLLNSRNIDKDIKFIKLRGSDRKYFIRLYDKTKFSKKSFIIKLLNL